MLAHLPDGGVLALIFHQQFRLPQEHLPHLVHPRCRRNRFAPIPGHQLPEDPRVASGTPGHHDTVAAGLGKHLRRRLGRHHVPISDDRNGDGLLHLPDNVPVRMSGIILFSRSAMDSHRRRSTVLDDLRDLHRIYMTLVKSAPDFHCHRFLHRLYHRSDDFAHQLRIFHEG